MVNWKKMDDNEAANGTGPYIIPLELESEVDSLIQETGEFNGVVSKLTRRKPRQAGANRASSSMLSTGFRGLLRTKTAFAVRNVIFVACLAWIVLLGITKLNSSLNEMEQHVQDEDPRGPHQSSFGGIKNTGHPAGAKAHEKHEESYIHYWESNVGERVVSHSQENDINHNGHYWHDPNQSPFASHLYNRTNEELKAEQDEFDAKMNATKQTWGAWNLVDPFYPQNTHPRPAPDFASSKLRDLPLEEFPYNAWQFDEEYVGKFINEARDMIDRVKEGIYAEYGHPTKTGDATTLSGDDLEKRDALFQVILEGYKVSKGQALDTKTNQPKPGIAYMKTNAWDALVQKLLHTLITNDRFYVVLAGDAAAAGHGNNFLQSSIMQFHYVMEPVFDFLGMTLISRNMAMRSATTYSALGGADIYGEADVMWFSGKVESPGQLDLFHKQAILSGERVPILLTPSHWDISRDSDDVAWTGNLQPGGETLICPNQTPKNADTVAPACFWLVCNKNKGWCKEQYNSVCWENRIDVTPPVPQDSGVPPEGMPGYLKHRFEGRKLSMLILHALDAALDKWEAGIAEDGFPLDEDYWHVGEIYDEVRESVRTHEPKDDTEAPSCDALFSKFPIVCHVEMHAFSEWTPRVTPSRTSLSEILYPKMDSLNFEIEPLYEDIDVLPLSWKIPVNQVDVHAIAIATMIPPLEETDDGYTDDDYFDYDDDFDGDDMSWFDYEDDLYDMDYVEGEDLDALGGGDRRALSIPEVSSGAGYGGSLRRTAANQPGNKPAPAKGKPAPAKGDAAAKANAPAKEKPAAPEAVKKPAAAKENATVSATDKKPADPKAGAATPKAKAASATTPAPKEQATETAPKQQTPTPGGKAASTPADKPAPKESAAGAPAEKAAETKDNKPAATTQPPKEKPAAKPAPEDNKPAATQPPKEKPTEKAAPEESAATATKAAVTPAGTEPPNENASKDGTITPGLGWTVKDPIAGFCDGSSQSTCNRSSKNTCLLSGHNEFTSGVLGDALSGWLMLRIEHVKEGVILARLDTKVAGGIDPVTDGWTAIDQGNEPRRLNIPGDFQFDYAINGNVTTLSRTEFLEFGVKIVDDMVLYPLLLDESMSKIERSKDDEGETIDVAIRIRSALGRDATILLSHLYYA